MHPRKVIKKEIEVLNACSINMTLLVVENEKRIYTNNYSDSVTYENYGYICNQYQASDTTYFLTI